MINTPTVIQQQLIGHLLSAPKCSSLNPIVNLPRNPPLLWV
jgi:hypothetical protein